MDIRLKEIAGKPAGTYFLVTDSSCVTQIEQTSNLRLFFINVEKGPVNTIVVFKKGDVAGFQSIFGKTLRKNEKNGNFSIQTCLDAIAVSGIAVMNLRVFDDSVDKCGLVGLSPNKTIQEDILSGYTKIFNINGLWTAKPKNIQDVLLTENLLNIANIGNSDVSFFVTLAKSVSTLTTEGESTLLSSTLEIEDFPALDKKMLLKETFVDVYIFNNTFDPTTVSTNRYYGQLFGVNGLIDYTNLDTLALIPEAGFNRKITGSLIPNLKNENGEDISIDTLMNNVYVETNLLCHINDNLLELPNIDDLPVINTNSLGYYDNSGSLVSSGNMLSHRLQTLTGSVKNISLSEITYADGDIALQTTKDILNITAVDEADIFPNVENKNIVYGIFENGIRVGDKVLNTLFENELTVLSINIVEQNSVNNFHDTQGGTHTYTKVEITLSGPLTGLGYTRINDVARKSKVVATNLVSYKPRLDQFTNGTASRQNDILDMIVSPGIVKGLKNFSGIRYVVDCFKSFIEASYKSQYGQLMLSLDKSNKFVRTFINEPFIEDLEKSTDPLFKQSSENVFDLTYIVSGGNPNHSTNFMTKFASGSEMCFYFGSKLVGQNEKPTAADVSNLFVQKTYPFDVVANSTGYLDNIAGLVINPDDDERLAMEKFGWNPIIKNDKGFTIYGNSTGQKTKTALAQIHNSELLAFIKESLFNLSRDTAFKKGTYNEYLATEVEVQTFMNDLALAGAIQPNPIVICNASNNTTDISKQKIKLIHIEYYNIDSLDKVVFDLNLK